MLAMVLSKGEMDLPNSPKSLGCSMCKVEFKCEESMDNHIDSEHKSVPIKGKKEAILPEDDWMTMNTIDLKKMLESIPIELLNMDEEEEILQNDYLEILNKCETTKETQNMNPEKNKCEKCKFKTTSSRNLRMHVNLVHDPKFFNCDQCDIKAKTKVALKHHKES